MSFFPEYFQTVQETNSSSEMAELLTVEDLLTQTLGHATGSSGAAWRIVSTSWIAQFFKITIAYKPGTFFKYSSAPSCLLSAIIHRTTGQGTKSFLMPRLFQPLRMTGLTWDVGPEDINSGGNGISCRSSDLLKLAILHLQGGVWQGQRLLSEEWELLPRDLNAAMNMTTNGGWEGTTAIMLMAYSGNLHTFSHNMRRCW